MKYKITIYILILTSVFIIGCDNTNTDDCTSPIQCESSIGPAYFYEDSSVHFYAPTFNPNNSNEFVTVQVFRPNSWTNIVSVIKYNYITHQTNTALSDTTLQNNNINFCRYNWSSNGWIVFENCNNNQLYKVHDNGSNLQQITFDGGNFYPNFTYDGNKIFYSNYSIALAKDIGILMDINTNTLLDTIFEPSYSSTYYFVTSINNSRLICTKSDNYIRVIDENGLSLLNKFQPITSESNFSNYIYFRNIGSNTNEVMFIAAYKGIYKLNINTHSVQLIKKSCIREQISSISVSPDGSKVLYQLDKYDQDDNEPCLVKMWSEIHLMNIDGTNDQVINLP